jgi:hypothetical protein
MGPPTQQPAYRSDRCIRNANGRTKRLNDLRIHRVPVFDRLSRNGLVLAIERVPQSCSERGLVVLALIHENRAAGVVPENLIGKIQAIHRRAQAAAEPDIGLRAQLKVRKC